MIKRKTTIIASSTFAMLMGCQLGEDNGPQEKDSQEIFRDSSRQWNRTLNKLVHAGFSKQYLLRPIQDSSVDVPAGEVTLVSQDVEFPESTFSAGAYVGVSGPAYFDVEPGLPATLSLFHRRTGEKVKTIEIPYPIEDTSQSHLVLAAIPGAFGDVYVNNGLDHRVYRFNTVLEFGEAFSEPLNDVPNCVDANDGVLCSQSTLDMAPMANSLLALADGSLLVSDSRQASVWKIPSTPDVSGQRVPQLWLTAPELEGNTQGALPFGTNGLAQKDGYLYIANTTGGPNLGGAIYRIPIAEQANPQALELVVAYSPFQVPTLPFPLPQGPDGLTFDVEGKLWVTFAFSNRIESLSLGEDGVVSSQNFTHNPSDGIGFVQPSELSLDSRAKVAYIANHAVEPPMPEAWALFKMSTGVRGAPLEKPLGAWDCSVHDCAGIDWRNLDYEHIANLVFEFFWGL